MKKVKKVKQKKVTGNRKEKKGTEISDFRAMFEAGSAPYLVLLPDNKFTIAAVNDSYNKATMTKREDIIGRPLFDVFPDNPDDPAADGVRKLRASLGRVLKHKKPDAMELQKYDIPKPATKGGGFEVRYWDPLNSPLLDKNKKIKYILHRVIDVTEVVKLKEKQAEQEEWTKKLKLAESKHIRSIREMETLFRHLTDNLEDYAVFMLDDEGTIVNWNEGAEKMHGYMADEITGRNISVLYNQEELAENKPKQDMKEAVTNGRHRRLHKHQHKNGALFISDIVITPIYNDAGLLTGFTCITHKLRDA